MYVCYLKVCFNRILSFLGTRCTKFNQDVLEETDCNGDIIKVWCVPGKKPSDAICCICNTTIDCSKRGSSAVKRHATSVGHIQKCKNNRKEDGTLKKPSQQRLTSANNQSQNISVLSHQDKILSSEILFVFSIISKNVPYAYGDVATSVFPKMFSDSLIAQDFTCGRTKLSYMVSDGIGPYFKTKLLDDIVKYNAYYSLQIDETPVPEKRSKQLDLNVRFYSEEKKKFVVNHLESFLIGHGTANILFGKVNDALLHLPDSKLINLFSDGPNVMKSLKVKMKEKYPSMLDIGTCNLHVLHNAFAKGLEGFGADLETLLIDLYYFFKRSASQCEDLIDLQIEFDFPEHVLLRHVDSRWLTLHSSVERFIEQFPVLTEFFSAKNSTKYETQRFKKICQSFASKSLLAKAYFLRNTSEMFVNIMKLLQKEEPLIHILYDELEQLLKKAMGRFLKVKYFADLHGSNLAKFDLNKGEFWLPNPEVGLDTQGELQKLSTSDRKSFYLGARSFYMRCVKYLQKMLPLDNQLLRDLKCLHPLYITKEASASCLKRVTSQMPFVVSPPNVTELIDEWVMLQTEDILSLMSSPDEPLDQFWNKVFELKDSLGQPKFKIIPNVIKALIILSHGNADCERGFSVNKIVLEGRSQLSIESINGIRQIKSFLKYSEDVDKININRELLNAARNSRKNYFQRLENQKTESEKKRKLEDDSTCDELGQLKSEGKVLSDQLKAAQNLLSLAQSHITNGLAAKDLTEIEGGNVLLKEANERIPELVKKIDENKAKQLKYSSKKKKN